VDQIRAIEENGEEFLVALGRAAGAQREHRSATTPRSGG
jgi:hypothetical protein